MLPPWKLVYLVVRGGRFALASLSLKVKVKVWFGYLDKYYVYQGDPYCFSVDCGLCILCPLRSAHRHRCFRRCKIRFSPLAVICRNIWEPAWVNIQRRCIWITPRPTGRYPNGFWNYGYIWCRFYLKVEIINLWYSSMTSENVYLLIYTRFEPITFWQYQTILPWSHSAYCVCESYTQLYI